MRMNWYITTSALIWLLFSPSLLGQEFLKQLEEKLLQKQNTAQAEPKSEKEQTSVPAQPPKVEFPSVLEPEPESLPTPPRRAEPSKNPANAAKLDELDQALEGTRGTKKGNTAPPKTSLLPPSPFPGSGVTPPRATKPAGGGYLGLEVEAIPGSGFGLTVVDVTPDSPAWKAGFRSGDRIVGVNGQAVSSVDAFASQLGKFSAGSPVKFLVDRRGKNANLVAVLQDRAVAGQIQGNRPGTALELTPEGFPQNRASNRAYFGVNVSDMSDGFRRQFSIPAYRGASVTSVVASSPAEAAGLKPGDCIVEMNGVTVQSAEVVLDTILQSKPGQLLSVSFYRGRQLNNANVLLASEFGDPNGGVLPQEVTPEMQTPEYVAALQSELQRVSKELQETQARLQQLEQRLQAFDRNR
jgi:hypothetical protein